jgi:integrase
MDHQQLALHQFHFMRLAEMAELPEKHTSPASSSVVGGDRSSGEPSAAHEVRHTFASLGRTTGESAFNVARMMGHSRSTLVDQVYAHTMHG